MKNKRKYEEPELTIISVLFSDCLLRSADRENGYNDAGDYQELGEDDVDLDF